MKQATFDRMLKDTGAVKNLFAPIMLDVEAAYSEIDLLGKGAAALRSLIASYIASYRHRFSLEKPVLTKDEKLLAAGDARKDREISVLRHRCGMMRKRIRELEVELEATGAMLRASVQSSPLELSHQSERLTPEQGATQTKPATLPINISRYFLAPRQILRK